MIRAGMSLDGALELLGANLVLVVSWTTEVVARIHAASPGPIPAAAIALPRQLVRGEDRAAFRSPVDAGWMLGQTLGLPLDGEARSALLVLGAGELAPDGSPESAFVALWGPAHPPPPIVHRQREALRTLLDAVVRGVRAAEAETQSRARLDALLATVPEGIVLIDEEAGTALVNAAAATLLEVSPGTITSAALAGAMQALRARCADSARLEQEGRALFASVDGARSDWLWEVRRPEPRFLRVSTLPVRAARHRGRLWTFEDVTALTMQQRALGNALAERERERDRLRESEERYRLARGATRDVIWDWDLTTNAVLWSEGLSFAFGHSPEALPDGDAWKAYIHPEDSDRVISSVEAVIASSGERWSMNYRFRRADGSYAFVRDRGTVLRDAMGTPLRMIGALVDESARHTLEEQLRQSQKMEAIGRLAGGVAHDFNNLLTVIQGSLTFARNDLPRGTRVHEDLAEAQRAVTRAAALTRQLLAFSQRQVLQPRALDLHAVIEGVEQLLRRVIGEDVRLDTALGAERHVVVADPGQVEQVLVNLAVNARDAMANGGVLSIRSFGSLPDDADSRVVPLDAARMFAEPHLVLAVTDTGSGMDEATRASAFEPFFTTKEAGKGTGLGLAIVYGLVEQTGGVVWLESAPGIGTTVWIVLPVTGEAPAAQPLPAREAAPVTRCTVLLVEDEENVRTLATRILRRAGYAVIGASSGRDGLRAWAEHGGASGTIAAVITDVVMPEMGGREFVRMIRAERDRIPVLFVSGYAEGGLAAAELGGRTAFLEKPFTGDTLLRHLAMVLAAE